MDGDIQNILIAGIGGQGVNTLSTVIQKILLDKNIFCKGAVYKGGAQKRGTIYSTIRIFNNKEIGAYSPSTISTNGLDTLLALEASESLRYAKFYNPDTCLLVNDFKFPFFNERYKSDLVEVDVHKELKGNFKNLHFQKISEQSVELFGNESMINVLIGLEAIQKGMLPIDAIEFLDLFQQKTRMSYDNMVVLMDKYDIQ